jgi:3',5'-cyclic AMP phosphodiesterase CpdA
MMPTPATLRRQSQEWTILRIALISDTHLAARAKEFAANFEAASRWIGEEKFDLVIHLGDVTADGASEPIEIAEVSALLASCPVEIRYLPGNHDVGDNPPAPGAASDEPPFAPERLEAYRAVFGADRWALEAEGWRLVGLDAQLFGTGTAEEADQFTWLEAEMKSVNCPVGLFVHKPFFRHGPGDTEAHSRYVPAIERRRLFEIMQGRDLRFVVSGHAHQRRRFTADRTEHVWLPSTAFVIPDALQERIGDKVTGAAILDLRGDGYDIAFVKPAGMADYDLFDHPHVYPQIADLPGSILSAAGR